MKNRRADEIRPMLLSMVTVAALVSACDFDPRVDSTNAPITNGNVIDPLESGIGLTDQDCTLTFVEPGVALTARKCADFSLTVDFDGEQRALRGYEGYRAVINDSRSGGDRDLVAVHLRKPFGQSIAPFGRRVDTRPLKAGENIVCHGFSNGKASAGWFQVEDTSTDRVHLRGHQTNGGVAVVARSDRGGFCTRDSVYEIAAILVGETKQGIAEAARVHEVSRGVEDVVFASQFARRKAVRLVDAKRDENITAWPFRSAAERESFQIYQKAQGFYLDAIAAPAGGSDWYRIVDFLSGECLTAALPHIRMEPCGGGNDQAFLETSVAIDERNHFTYRSASHPGVIDASSQFLTIAPVNGSSAQQFTMRLADF